ncbi:MAG: GAF domain-containing protein [Candidatus Hodarchaeales archaeon]|jgi:GAF domain-containing protein
MQFDKEDIYKNILDSMTDQLKTSQKHEPAEIYKIVVTELAKIPYFDWTGIYLLNHESQELILDYYIGAETEHTVIPVGTGVCGAAVADNIDKVIYDVREESNYLACSLGTRSEIVVLIRDGDKILGQIDVDSDTVGAFDNQDKTYLQKVASIITQFLFPK